VRDIPEKLIFMAIVFGFAVAVIAHGQTTTCTHLTYRDTTLCTWEDGSGTLTDYDGQGGSRDTRFDTEHWGTLRDKLISEDTEKIRARTAQLAAIEEKAKKDEAALEARLAMQRKAWAITRKKQCETAGFVWQGSCDVGPGVPR